MRLLKCAVPVGHPGAISFIATLSCRSSACGSIEDKQMSVQRSSQVCDIIFSLHMHTIAVFNYNGNMSFF